MIFRNSINQLCNRISENFRITESENQALCHSHVHYALQCTVYGPVNVISPGT